MSADDPLAALHKSRATAAETFGMAVERTRPALSLACISTMDLLDRPLHHELLQEDLPRLPQAMDAARGLDLVGVHARALRGNRAVSDDPRRKGHRTDEQVDHVRRRCRPRAS